MRKQKKLGRTLTRTLEPVAFFSARYRAQGNKARAEAEKRYLKSALSFHGVSLPIVRRAAADFLRGREHEAPLTREELIEIVDALYATDFHDLRSTAIDLLERRRALLRPADVPWLVELAQRDPGWAHLDWLAAKVIGPLVQDTRAMAKLLRTWARHESFWVRRIALLAQLVALRSGGGDFALFERIAAPMLDEKEFFIRKAIGWVLRETAKRRPAPVREFIEQHGARMSGLTRREAEKGLRFSRAR